MKRVVLAASVLAVSFLCGAAKAGIIVNVSEIGGDVVFSGSGTLNLDALSHISSESWEGYISPIQGDVLLGSSPASFAQTLEFYSPTISGPSKFGPGNGTLDPIIGDGGTGDRFGMANIVGLGPAVIVPDGYVSGDPLVGSLTFSGTSLATLGVTEGVYVWSWGTGGNADTFTLNVTAVPEPSAFFLWGLTTILFGVRFCGRQKGLITHANGECPIGSQTGQTSYVPRSAGRGRRPEARYAVS